MLYNFIFSKEGFIFLQEYSKKFGCRFRIDEPAGDAILIDVGDDTFAIKDDGDVEAFKKAAQESVKTGKNVLLDAYKGDKVEYDDDLVY